MSASRWEIEAKRAVGTVSFALPFLIVCVFECYRM